MSHPPTIGLIGFSRKGAIIARGLVGGGVPLEVWVRPEERLDRVPDGARVHRRAADLAAGCDLLCLCLGDDERVAGDDAALEALLLTDGLLAALPPGAVVANHGTGSPELCRRLVAHGDRHGVTFLDAPVSGLRPTEHRWDSMMVGGDAAATERVRPTFEVIADLVVHLGPPGSGQLVKLLNNTLYAATLKDVEDAIALAPRLGVDRRALTTVVRSSSGGSFALETLVDRILPERASRTQAIVRSTVTGDDGAPLLSAHAPRAPEAAASLERAAVEGVAGLVAAVELVGEARRARR